MGERRDPGAATERPSGDRPRNGPVMGDGGGSTAPAGGQRSSAPTRPASIGRRELLGAIGTVAAAGLAGCSGGGGSSGPPIERPTSHTQDMTLTIGQDGSEQLQQEIDLVLDDPDFVMDFQIGGFDGSQMPMPGYTFVKVDGTVYMQMMGMCFEANQDSDDVQAMAATPERFEGNGGLEQTGTTTLDGVEVEVWEADVDDLPLEQLSFQPEASGDMGGQMPGGGEFEEPAYFDPDSIQEGTLKVWIGTENRYLRKAEQTAVFDADDTEFHFEMIAENDDFGEDFDIQAPANCGEGGGFGDSGFGG